MCCIKSTSNSRSSNSAWRWRVRVGEHARAQIGERIDVERGSACGIEWGQSFTQRVDAVGAAQTTAARGGAEARGGRRRQPASFDRDDVELARHRRTIGAVADAGDGEPGKHTLGVTKTDSEFVVVARRTHRGADLNPVELDRHRLLHDQVVGLTPSLAARGDAGNEQGVCAAAGHRR